MGTSMRANPVTIDACRNFPLAQKRLHGECELGADPIFHMPRSLHTVGNSSGQTRFFAFLKACTR